MSGPGSTLSAYERQRLATIEQNQAKLRELNLISAARELTARPRKAPRARPVRRALVGAGPHLRRSARFATSSEAEVEGGERSHPRTAAVSVVLGPQPCAHLHLLLDNNEGSAPRASSREADLGNGLKRALWNRREPDEAAGERARPRKTTQVFSELIRGQRVNLECSLADLMASPHAGPDARAEADGEAAGAVLASGDVLTVCIPGKGDVAHATLQSDGTLSGAGGQYDTLNAFVRQTVASVTATKFNAWLHVFRGGVVLDALRERWLREKYVRSITT